MPGPLLHLLHRCLDFAGLFPPASLPVGDALAQFRSEQAANRAEMLARLVCPTLRLDDVCAAATQAGDELRISVLPRGGKNTGEFLANLETDLAVVRRLADLHAGSIEIDVLELRPPADALAPLGLRKLLAAIDALLVRKAEGIAQVFVELAPAPTLPSQLELLADWNAPGPGGSSRRFGYKLRTGGSDAAAVPSPAHTAAALGACATLGLPLKCTGGLHNPLRTTGEGAPMHGFVNLLVAACLVSTAPAEPGLIEAVLEEVDPTAFTFDSRHIGWRNHRATSAVVAETRRKLLLSFGSCYAAQPRNELQRLGWWPRAPRAGKATTKE